MLMSLFTYAQSGSISGRVTDDTGQPLPGATIVVSGTMKNTQTDGTGSYKLSGLAAGSITLEVHYIGYRTLQQPVTVTGGAQTLDLKMQTDQQGLNEVVVIGYGAARKSDVTGSITTISTKDFNKGTVTTPDQLIVGKVAGVVLTSNGGAPGAGSTIRIRGGASLNASNDPLIVVDGVPIDNNQIVGASNILSFINPNDIESFNILKDASATAIFGSRASNGVIIITTKKGIASKKLNVNFSTVNAVSVKEGEVKVLSGDQFRTAIKAHNPNQAYLLGNANTNWQDEIYQNAFATDNNLSFSGGIKNLPYRLALGYTNQNGILKTSNLDRQSITLNLNPKFLDNHLSVDVSFKGATQKTRFADQGAVNAAVTFDPTQPVYQAGSPFGGYFEWVDTSAASGISSLATRNPVSMLELQHNQARVNRAIGNVKLDYSMHFLPELHAVLNLGADYSESKGTNTYPAYAGNAVINGGQYIAYSQAKQNQLLDFYFNYVKDLKGIRSHIDATAGYSYQDFWLSQPGYPTLNAKGDTVSTTPQPVKTQNTLLSYFGRVTYSYNDKYLLTGTVRRDGSSRFRQHWGTFPSVAFAWRIAQEGFLKNSKVLSDLKLRLGYGITGQQDILGNDYPSLPVYTPGDNTAAYQFGKDFITTLRPEGYDANIKWEQTTTYNAGLDFGFLNGRIAGTIDYYTKKTSDLISQVTVASGSNLTNQIYTNVGNITTKGLEFTVNAGVVATKDFTWNAGFNVSYNKVEITNLALVKGNNPIIQVGGISGGTGDMVQVHKVGYAPFTFFLYNQVYDKNGKPIEGAYIDHNGDSSITASDLVPNKSPNPKVTMGFNSSFNYKAWSLAFSVRANLGNYLYNNINSNFGTYANIAAPLYLTNATADVLHTQFTQSQRMSDYYLENASFLRMDNLSIGYDFGKLISRKVDLRATASAQNLFVITKYSGVDPEIYNGIDDKFYQRPRTFSLGINLGF